jgi:hypothetical protein
VCWGFKGSRFRVQGFRGSGVLGSGFGVRGSGFWVQGSRLKRKGFRISVGVRKKGFRVKVSGVGTIGGFRCRVSGFSRKNIK